MNKQKFKKKVVRKQPKADSSDPRVNFDNTRESKFEKDLRKTFSRRDSNDVRWYTKSPAMIDAAGRIPFSTISGLNTINEKTGIIPPGVMAMYYAPNFSPNDDVVMQAYYSTYSEIVHANSRNQSYDSADLAIMMMAGMEVFAAIAHGIRAYGLMRSFEEPNMFTPNSLLRACGFNPDDLRANYSHMYSDLLQLIAQSRQIWIPNTMSIVERRIWMNTEVYYDSDNTKAQYYLYVPKSFYVYSGFTEATGGKLVKSQKWDGANTTTRSTWANYLAAVQEMINALLPDQDRGIMYGDILKAYGKEGIFAMNDIALDYRTVVTYNKEVLWQIENATVISAWPVELVQTAAGRLEQHWQANEPIEASTAISTVSARTYLPRYCTLNMHQAEQPTTEQLCVATRLTSIGNKKVQNYTYSGGKYVADGTKKAVIPKTSGTEILVDIIIERLTMNITTGVITPSTSRISNHWYSRSGDVMNESELMTYVAFDWAPMVHFFSPGDTIAVNADPYTEFLLCEFDNWVTIDAGVLERLHNAILFSLFNVPNM